MKSFILIIPARLNSSRLPNKPLLKINGKEVLKHVYDRCKLACHKDKIVVATPDKKIADFCDLNKIKFIMTSRKCLTGTDRVIEVSKIIKKDFYINVQGDEIFVSPKSIKKIINKTKFYSDKFVLNGFTAIKDEKQFRSTSVPKVVLDKKNFLMYISRGAIPLNKQNKKNQYSMKQVCIYGYPYKLLSKITLNKKSKIEKYEDIEILRFLELGYKVKMIKMSNKSLAVDTQNDLDKAEIYLKLKKL